MERRRDGFSLIELIIAIAILVILTGLLAPQFLKYIEKSRKAVCMHSIDSLRGEYVVGMIETDGQDSVSALAVLDRIMKENGGKQTTSSDGEAEKAHGVYRYYTGLCKSGGEYQCKLLENFDGVVIECSRHGELELDIVTLKERLESISFDGLNNSALNFHNLEGYFNNSRKSIDSEAVSTGDAYAPYKSLADYLGQRMAAQGINVQDRSWRLYKDSSAYALYLTDKEITVEDMNDDIWVNCTKYDIKEKKVIQGKVKIGKNATSGTGVYPYIKGDSFRAD